MLNMSIKADFADAFRYIEAVGKQARFAAAVALTKTGQDVKAAEVEEIKRAIDKPTPYTLRSLFLRGATKDRLEVQVWVKDDRAGSGTPATRYLLPHIEGGERTTKGFESVLQRTGHMPQGYRAVPARFARLDAFGNVSRGQIIQILSQLKAQVTGGYDRNISTDAKKRAAAIKRAGGQFFSLPKGRGKLLPGIYQVTKFGMSGGMGPAGRTAPRPVFIFVPNASYKRIFAFHEVAAKVAKERFPIHFKRELEAALRSA